MEYLAKFCVESWLYKMYSLLLVSKQWLHLHILYIWCMCVLNLKVIAMNLHFGNAHFTQIQFIINESTTIMLNAQYISNSVVHTFPLALYVNLKLTHANTNKFLFITTEICCDWLECKIEHGQSLIKISVYSCHSFRILVLSHDLIDEVYITVSVFSLKRISKSSLITILSVLVLTLSYSHMRYHFWYRKIIEWTEYTVNVNHLVVRHECPHKKQY